MTGYLRPGPKALPIAKREGGDIITWTGRRVWPLDPRPGDFDIRDIARSLAFTNRWRGHIRFEMSVGLHSVLGSYQVPSALWRWRKMRDGAKHLLMFRRRFLLHDAPESLLGELASPIKPGMPEYVAIERRLSVAIAQEFGLGDLETPEVKEIDRRIAADEAMAVLPHWHLVEDLQKPLGIRIPHVRPERAYEMFLARYAELWGDPSVLDRRGRAWFHVKRWLGAAAT